MRSILASSLLLLSAVLCLGQTQVNPYNQIAWPGVTTSGPPTGLVTCDAAHFGMPDTDTTNNGVYFCSTSGWVGPFSKSTSGNVGSHTFSGCGVNYIGNLQFTVGACNYTIDGTSYTSPLTNVTLATGSSLARIDVIAVNASAQVVVLQGTPNANPQQPTVDPSSQLELTFVYVPALATSIPSITTNTIFDEGAEWGMSIVTSQITLSTNFPFHLTHDLEATVPISGYVYFTNPSTTFVLSDYNYLILYIKPKGVWASSAGSPQGLRLVFQAGGTNVGNQVFIGNGQYGFDSSNLNYQQIAIPVSAFNTGTAPINAFGVIISNAGVPYSAGFYLDYIQLQGGITQTTLPTTLMNFRGAWNAIAGYTFNDVVTSGGVGYVALQPNNNTAVSNTTYWAALGATSSGSISLTTNGNSGAATLTGGILNVPQYQGTIALTTNGTGGVATFGSNTLNIPQYQHQIVLTTNGSSGAATFDGTTLNVPQYSPGTFLTEVPTCSGSSCSLSFAPVTMLSFIRNGLVQTYTVDFTRSGGTITLVNAVTTGDTFYASYYH